MIIIFIFLALSTGFAVSFTLQKLIIKVSKEKNLFDRHDSRKLDKYPRSRLGGVGIFLGFITSSLVFLSFYNTDFIVFAKTLKSSDISFFLISMFIVFVIGLIDDLFGLNAWQKLPFEILAASILFFNGFSINLLSSPFGTGVIVFPSVLSYIITILWIITITNAMNLIDGIDGLAGGIAIFATISFVLMSFINDKIEFTLLSLGMLGSVIAFLIFNFYPSKIYMGDSGSLTLGFFLSTISLRASTKASFGISFLIPVIILFIPIFDTLLAFFRRILKMKNPFNADNDHIHHMFMKKGFNEKKTFFTIITWTAILSLFGVVSMFLSKTLRFMVFFIVFLFGFGLLYYLKYIKYDLLKKNNS